MTIRRGVVHKMYIPKGVKGIILEINEKSEMRTMHLKSKYLMRYLFKFTDEIH